MSKNADGAMVFKTPFGDVVFFPSDPEQLTVLRFPDGNAVRVRGYEKRLILSLCRAAALSENRLQVSCAN